MKDSDQEFGLLQRQWKKNGQEISPAFLSKPAGKLRFRRGSFYHFRRLIVTFLWTGGLLVLATYRMHLHGNVVFLLLAMSLLIVAAWLGTSSGPDLLSERPEVYVRHQSHNKKHELRKVRIAQIITWCLLTFSLLVAWLTERGHLQSSLNDQLLPLGVLLLTTVVTGALVARRGSKQKELAVFHELEKQFDHANRQESDGDTKSRE
jgi:hypothetical protein